MYEETVERIARMMAEDNGDPQHWGVYATRAMEIIKIADDRSDSEFSTWFGGVVGDVAFEE
jgi:hypothetical protein